ncbi:MAG TPA: hypothetical protein VFN03_03165, partial [Trueperaceae bacterium]|nr:hypothetical protein [Trueperaceae bacterium]
AAAFEAAVEAVPDGLPPRARLGAMITAHLGVVAEELATATVFFQDWVHLAPGRRSAMVTVRDAYQQRFVDVIEEGRSLGVFHVADPRMSALIVLSALNWSYQWLDPAGRLDLEAVANAYVHQMLDGLSARAARPDAGDLIAAGGQAGSATTASARTSGAVR